MSEVHDDLDGLIARTDGLEPAPDFADRVMAALAREPAPRAIWRAGAATLGVLAVAAAAAIYLANAAQGTLDSETIASFDTVEIEP